MEVEEPKSMGADVVFWVVEVSDRGGGGGDASRAARCASETGGGPAVGGGASHAPSRMNAMSRSCVAVARWSGSGQRQALKNANMLLDIIGASLRSHQ